MKLPRWFRDARDDLLCHVLRHRDYEQVIDVETTTGEIMPESLVTYRCSRCEIVLRQEEWRLAPSWVRARLSGIVSP